MENGNLEVSPAAKIWVRSRFGELCAPAHLNVFKLCCPGRNGTPFLWAFKFMSWMRNGMVEACSECRDKFHGNIRLKWGDWETMKPSKVYIRTVRTYLAKRAGVTQPTLLAGHSPKCARKWVSPREENWGTNGTQLSVAVFALTSVRSAPLECTFLQVELPLTAI